jgi:hypothetical protein
MNTVVTDEDLVYALHDQGMSWGGASRVVNALKNSGALTVKNEKVNLHQLDGWSPQDFHKLRGLGRKGIKALEIVLGRNGVRLRSSWDDPPVLRKWLNKNVNTILLS